MRLQKFSICGKFSRVKFLLLKFPCAEVFLRKKVFSCDKFWILSPRKFIVKQNCTYEKFISHKVFSSWQVEFFKFWIIFPSTKVLNFQSQEFHRNLFPKFGRHESFVLINFSIWRNLLRTNLHELKIVSARKFHPQIFQTSFSIRKFCAWKFSPAEDFKLTKSYRAKENILCAESFIEFKVFWVSIYLPRRIGARTFRKFSSAKVRVHQDFKLARTEVFIHKTLIPWEKVSIFLSARKIVGEKSWMLKFRDDEMFKSKINIPL